MLCLVGWWKLTIQLSNAVYDGAVFDDALSYNAQFERLFGHLLVRYVEILYQTLCSEY